MSANKQLILFVLTMAFVVRGPFSSMIFTYYFIYSGFVTGCMYVIIFRKMYFVYTNLFGQIKSILLTGWKAVTYASILLIGAIIFAILYPKFEFKMFLQTLPIGAILSFWVYKILIKYREDKLKTSSN